MDTPRAVVGDVVPGQTLEVTLLEKDDAVKKLPAAGPNPSFGRRVLPGTSIDGPYGFGAEAPNGRCDFGGEDRIAVVQEEAGDSVSRKGLPELLDHPRGDGMDRDVEVKDPS